MKILVTGAAGYIGGMAVDKFKSLPQALILALDKKDNPNQISNNVKNLKLDLAKDNWEEAVGSVDIVVHCAFDIKSVYGKIPEQYFNNIQGSKRVFDYCFKNNVSRLVYLSSAAAYGAKPENIGKLLKETDPLQEKEYPYGSQKREVEEIFSQMLEQNKNNNLKTYFLRLATVNGEVGKKRKRNLFSFLKSTPLLPYANNDSARQYINEEDVVSAIDFLINYQGESNFEVFNLAPRDILTFKEMAKLQKKTAIKIPNWLIRTAFSINWHLLRGKIFATAPGSDNSFIYPSNLDGSKIAQKGFKYKYTSLQTFEIVAK